ncbi:hypothetical protein Tco_1404810 [Tanacetum coccineum]
MPVTERVLARNLQGFHDATYKANENTDIALRNYKKILAQFKTKNAEGINRVSTNLQEVQNVVKEDPTLNKKVLEADEVDTKNSSNLTELLTLVKDLDVLSIKSTIESLQAAIIAQNDHLAKWAESTVSMAWSVGHRITRIKNTQATIKSDISSLNLEPSPEKKVEEKKETPSHLEEEQENMVIEEPNKAKVAGSLDMTPRVDKGKVIAIKIDPSSSKLVKTSRKVRQDHDAPQMEQSVKEIELCKPKIMKVAAEVVNEAKVQLKGSKDFLKHHDSHLKVLTRAHHEKLKKKADFR